MLERDRGQLRASNRKPVQKILYGVVRAVFPDGEPKGIQAKAGSKNALEKFNGRLVLAAGSNRKPGLGRVAGKNKAEGQTLQAQELEQPAAEVANASDLKVSNLRAGLRAFHKSLEETFLRIVGLSDHFKRGKPAQVLAASFDVLENQIKQLDRQRLETRLLGWLFGAQERCNAGFRGLNELGRVVAIFLVVLFHSPGKLHDRRPRLFKLFNNHVK